MLENLLMTAFEISLTSSIAIAAVLILSKFSEKKFSAKWRYWIWLLIAVRLILPFNIDIPFAPVNLSVPKYEMVVTKAPKAPQAQLTQQAPTLPEEAPSLKEAVTEPGVVSQPAIPEALTEQPEGTPSRSFTVLYAVGIVWLAVGLLVFAYNLFSYLRYRKILSPWDKSVQDENILRIFDEAKNAMGIQKKLPLYENHLLKSPMMIGFFNPRVVLPSAEFSDNEYRMILRHELTHYRRHDLWYKLVLVLAVSLHWFNPLVKMLCKAAENDIEISCDEAAVRFENEEFREEYCKSVLKIMRKGQNAPMVLSTGFYGGTKVLKKRFSAVLNKKTKKGTVPLAAAVLITILCGTLIACSIEDPALNRGPGQSTENSSGVTGLTEIPLPEVTGPDENGYFPVISQEDWDQYIRRSGPRDEKEPEEPITPFEENKLVIAALYEMAPDIGEWEVLYEKNNYVLSYEYDPYSYCFREKYSPKYFVVLRSEGAGEKNHYIFEYRQTCIDQRLEDGSVQPRLSGYGTAIGFSSEEFAPGDFSKMQEVCCYDVNCQPSFYFPDRDATILVNYNTNEALEVKGSVPEMVLFDFYKIGAAATLESDYTRRPDLPESAKNDSIVMFYNDSHIDWSYYYYDYETKTLHPFGGEETVAGSKYMEHIDDEIMILEAEHSMEFYRITSEAPWEPYAVIELSDLTDKEADFIHHVYMDKTLGGRLLTTYVDGPRDSDNDIRMITFDFEGNVLSDFSLGLKATGYIGSISYHDGLAYFSYHNNKEGSFRYAVDTRPDRAHILQENAW